MPMPPSRPFFSSLTLVALCLLGFLSLAYGKISESLLNRAKLGDPEAQFRVGLALLKGDGVEMNAELAYFMFSEAAEQGHVPAQLALGKRYAYGRGVPEDKEEAILWLECAFADGTKEERQEAVKVIWEKRW